MKRIHLIFFLALLISSSGISQETLQDLQFLLGSWQVEEKNSYEAWEKVNDSVFSGKSYKLVEGEQKISETITLTNSNGDIIYEPTVPDQNEGRAIPFLLNNTQKELYSFENSKHDFPKKIQYKQLDENTLWVNVLGDEDQGFSYRLIRQP